MEAIAAEQLSKHFGGVVAVDGVSFTVSEGELFGLVGSDGAGKTTTIRMLTGIMDPSAGSARIMGFDTVREALQVREVIGYMSQRFGLYPDLTVLENVHFYADIYGLTGKERNRKVEELLAFSNLLPFQKRKAGALSGGMKQKLGLTCALVHTPRVLFLDEPTNGVDPVSRRDFWRILHKLLKDGVTIFASTAYLDEADRFNRVGLIHGGKLVACDTPDGLRSLMHGTIIEIQTVNARAAVRTIQKHFPDTSVGLFGDRVHLVSDTPESAMAELQVVMRETGMDFAGVRLVEPTLEDVYLSVLSSLNGADAKE